MVETRATDAGPGDDGILGTPMTSMSIKTPPRRSSIRTRPTPRILRTRCSCARTSSARTAPHATGKLIDNRDLGADGHFGGTGANADTLIGGMATWAVVKAQARDLLGINLTDKDFDNVPLLATDAYGNFIKGRTASRRSFCGSYGRRSDLDRHETT